MTVDDPFDVPNVEDMETLNEARTVEELNESDPASRESAEDSIAEAGDGPSLWRRALSIALVVLLVAAVLPFVVYAVPAIVGADASFVVLTASMTPAIAPADVVIVADRDPATVQEGDVITFFRGTSDVPVTHRVVGVLVDDGAYAFETKGDANDAVDAGMVPGENLIGTVILVIPYIGYVIQFASTPEGFIALVVLPFGLLLLTELWSFIRGRKPTGSATDSEDPDHVDSAAELPAPATSPTAASVPSNGDGVTTDSVAGAAIVLAGFAPYSVYVAVQLRSALTITVAIVTTVLLIAAVALWIPTSDIVRSRSSIEGEKASDGGSAGRQDDRPVALDGGGEDR